MSSFEVLHPHCLGPILFASCELQTQTLENLLVHGLCCSSNTKTQLAKWPGVHFPYKGDASRLYLLNSTYVTLLPKKSEAIKVKDFRPISLIHSFAKIVTKILANRLAPKLPDLVSVNQSAFVKGRSIHDNFVMVQQTTKAIHGQKISRVLLKLDIGKAFDSVSWTFLFEVLRHLGFGPLWCGIISRVLSSSTTRVLVNGEPGDIIHHRRGLR
jgi:hypothetical protein